MNSLSVFAGVLLFFACSFVGLWLKRRFNRKASFYEEYYRYLLYVLDKISYERTPFSEMNQGFCANQNSEFFDYLLGEASTPPISDAEIANVGKYLSEIGTTDADTQIASLGGKCAEMKRFSENEVVKYRKDGTVYFKLSVLFGIVVFIIIV